MPPYSARAGQIVSPASDLRYNIVVLKRTYDEEEVMRDGIRESQCEPSHCRGHAGRHKYSHSSDPDHDSGKQVETGCVNMSAQDLVSTATTDQTTID